MKGVQGDNLRCRCLIYRFLYLSRWIPLLEPIDSDTSSLFSIISYWKNSFYGEIEEIYIHLYQMQFTVEVLENWHYMCQMLTFWWKKKKSQPPKYFRWERKYFFVEILTCGLMGVTGQCFRLPISTTGQNICPDYIFHEGSRFLLLVILVMPLGILMVMKNHKAWAYQAVRTGQMRLGAWSSWVILSVQCQSSMVLRHLKKKVLAKC